ncbi:MAG: DUF2182 domain-containing protein, partial [Dokdonella sp.]
EAGMRIVDTHVHRGVSRNARSLHAFLGVSALLFIVSAAMTIRVCTSMSSMHEMPMPGGWTMSMTWMRMPGQTWTDASAAFLGMWLAMMVAMMLPSLLPMLWRYRQSMGGADETHLALVTALVGVAYFFVWTVFGAAIFASGIALTKITLQSPAFAHAVPLVVGLVVVVAGALQFSAWKARHLACCRAAMTCPCTETADIGKAWRHGLRLGVHCCECCIGPTTILLVMGVMDLRAMAAVTAAITIERFAPAAERSARGIGILVVALGLTLIARSLLTA